MDRHYFISMLECCNPKDRAVVTTIIQALDACCFWEKPSSIVFNVNSKCYAFITLEESYAYLHYIFTKSDDRGSGLASKMLHIIHNHPSVARLGVLAFFSKIETVPFYEKLGYSLHVHNPKMPLFYGSLDKKLLYPVPASLTL